MDRFKSIHFNTARLQCLNFFYSSEPLWRPVATQYAICVFYSIAGLYAQQLLQPVARARHAYLTSTWLVNYEYLGMTAAPMHNKIRIGAFE